MYLSSCAKSVCTNGALGREARGKRVEEIHGEVNGTHALLILFKQNQLKLIAVATEFIECVYNVQALRERE